LVRVFLAGLIATLSLGSGDWVSPVASGRRGADRVWSCSLAVPRIEIAVEDLRQSKGW